MSGAVRLRGVFAAAITPLDADARPDPERAAAYCARLLDAGCDGINLLGTTGEAASFTVGERIAVMEGVAARVDPARCMVGTGASAFGDALALTRAALELGYGGALVIPPFYYKGLREDDVVAWYARLIETVADARLRLYLYHFPALGGVPLAPATVARLAARYPHTVAGLKDSEGAAGYAEALAAAHPEIAIFPSDETRLLDGPARGFAGCISASVQLAPSFARIVLDRSASDDDVARAHATLGAIRAAVVRYGTIPAVRHAAARLFDDASLARAAAPVGALAPERARELDAALDAIPALAHRLSGGAIR